MNTNKRFSKTDWLELALALLGKEGPEAMTVERLCAAAERTRGSLYHHFGDHNSFLYALLEFWQEQYTVRVMESVGDPSADSGVALEHLHSLAHALNFDVEVNIRRLVAIHPSLKEIVSLVDQTRIEFIEEHYKRIGKRIPMQARFIAELEYAIFIGIQHIEPDISVSKRNDLYKAFSQLITLD